MSAMSSAAAPPIVIQNVAVNAIVAAATNAIESQVSHLSDVSKFGNSGFPSVTMANGDFLPFMPS